MKKIIALLLAVACCVGMVGCNKNDRDASKLDIDASIDINFSGDSDFSSKESVKVVDFPAEVKENTFNVFSAESINTSHSNELYATITCKAETDLDDGIYTSKNVKVFVNDKERKCDVLSYLEVNGSKIIVQYNVDCGYSPKDSKIEIVVKDFNYLNKTATDEDGVVNASDVSNKVAYEGGIKIQVDVAMTFGNAMVNLADYGLGDATLTVSTNAVSISNSQNVFDNTPSKDVLSVHLSDGEKIVFEQISESEKLDDFGNPTGVQTITFYSIESNVNYDISNIEYVKINDTQIKLDNK